MPVRISEEERVRRFWARVHIYKKNDCWEWHGYVNPGGYGQVSQGHNNPAYAHRRAYELLVGPIPAGLQLDHLCRNKICVNPQHLEIVTCRVNLMRGFSTSAIHAQKTHCIHGHKFDQKNTYLWEKPNGLRERHCKQCGKDRRRAIKEAA